MVVSSYEWKIVEMDKNIKQMNNQLLAYNNSLVTPKDQGQIEVFKIKKNYY